MNKLRKTQNLFKCLAYAPGWFNYDSKTTLFLCLILSLASLIWVCPLYGKNCHWTGLDLTESHLDFKEFVETL